MNMSLHIWRAVLAGLVIFMISPLLVLLLFCFSDSSLIAFPIRGLTFAWFYKLADSPQFWASLENSLIITCSIGIISTIIGTMSALAFAGMGRRTAGIGLILLTLPVMMPPLMLGVVLLTYFSSLGVRLGLPTVVMAHLVFTQPFVIMIVYARMRTFDYAVVNSARDLGASQFKAFFTVTLPMTRPTIIGAAMVAMALSLDDFLVTFFTIGGGNTLPTLLWGLLRRVVDPTINVVAVLLMTLTIGTSLIALRMTRYRG